MKEDSNGDNGNERVPALSLDSPWAWFYYSTFAAQVIVVTAYMLRHQVAVAAHEGTLDIYIAILLRVSVGVPAMAAYSLLIAVTVEAARMIAEKYLAKRFRQGKKEGVAVGKAEGIAVGKAEGIAVGKAEGIAVGKVEGISEVLEMLDEDTRKEVERKLQRSGNSNRVPEHD